MNDRDKIVAALYGSLHARTMADHEAYERFRGMLRAAAAKEPIAQGASTVHFHKWPDQ